MTLRKKLFPIFGVPLFILGVVVGTLLFGMSVWGDFEANLFDARIPGDFPFEDLDCPVLITDADTAAIAVTISNPGDEPAERRVRARITEGFVTLIREEDIVINMDPGQTERLEWPISSDDAAFQGLLVLARVYMFRRLALPSADGSCGIMALHTSRFTGAQIYTMALVTAVVGILAGFGLWVAGKWPLKDKVLSYTGGMAVLGVAVFAGIFFSRQAWMLAGVLALVFTVLLMGAMLLYLAQEN